MKTAQLIAALAAAVLFALPAAAFAQGEPNADEIQKVMDYFNSGKGRGPILTAFKACVGVDSQKDSATRFECTETVSGPVKKGTLVHAWTSWFVPQNDSYDDITVRYFYEGQLRSTQDITVTTSFRTRSFKSLALTKTGSWEIQVVRGEKVLASTKVTVG